MKRVDVQPFSSFVPGDLLMSGQEQAAFRADKSIGPWTFFEADGRLSKQKSRCSLARPWLA